VHRNEHTVEIDAAPEVVFPYLADGERRLRWMGALKKTEPLTEGAPAVGSRWHDVFEDHGQRVELEAELAVYEPPERLLVRLASRMLDATSEQRLERVGRKTRLTTVIVTEYKALVARLAAGMVTRHAQRQLEADLAALKELAESDSG
jgi:uncharacterized protein YndB with AHSA1/START domain